MFGDAHLAIGDHVALFAAVLGMLLVGAAITSAVVAWSSKKTSTSASEGRRVSIALWTATSFAIGLGAVGSTLFVRSTAFDGFGSPWWLVGGWSLGFLVAWMGWRRARSQRAAETTKESASEGDGSRPLRAAEPLLLLIILFNLGCSAFLAMDKPVWQYDALTRWGYKARAFTHDRSVVPYFEDLERGVTQPHYPPLVPLGMTWINLSLDREDDRLSKVLFAATFAALLLALYGLLRLRVSSTITLGGTALLSMTPCLSYLDSPPGVGAHSALADVPLALVTLLSLGLLFEGCRVRRPGFLVISFLLAGIAPWIKQEGAILMAANPVLILLLGRSIGGFGKRFATAIALGLLAAATMAPWYLYQRGVPITDDVYLPMDFSGAALSDSLGRLPTIGWTFAREMVRTDLWGLLWPIAILALLLAPLRSLRNGASWMVLVIAGHMVIYAAVYALEDFHGVAAYEQKMAVSLTRLFMHLAPLAVLVAGWQAESILATSRSRAGNALGAESDTLNAAGETK